MNSQSKSLIRAYLCAFLLSAVVTASAMDSCVEKEVESHGFEWSLPVSVQNGWNGAKDRAHKLFEKIRRLRDHEKQVDVDSLDNNELVEALAGYIEVDDQEIIEELVVDPSSLYSDEIPGPVEPSSMVDEPSESGVDFVLEDAEQPKSTPENLELVNSNSWLGLLGGTAFMGLAVGVGYCLCVRTADDSLEK